MKLKIVYGVVVLALVLGASWYYYLGTPRYSLAQTRKAMQNHDSITFNKYVDVDRVVDGIIAEATADMKDDEDNMFAGLAQAMMGSFRAGLKESLNKNVEDLSGDTKHLSEFKIEKVEQEGKSAEVTLSKAGEKSLRVSMIQTPERYWRIVRVNAEDLKEVSPSLLNDAEESEDTESGDEKRIETSAKFGDTLTIGDGWSIVVQKPEDYISTNSFERPETGKKVVALSVEYTNDTDSSDTVSPSNLTLKDKDNQAYDMSTWGGKEPMINYGATVPAHDKLKGYVNFVIPEGAEIVKAVYSNDYSTITVE